MKRTVIPELLDADLGTPLEVRRSLEDLRRINRWFGGARAMTALLARVAEATGQRRLSLLDVGAATGDVPLAARRHLARRGVVLDVTLLDQAASHLSRDGAAAVAAHALALPFAGASFSVVTSSLLVHHLEPDELVRFVNEALRVARHAVLINDLRRHPVHLGLVYAGFPLYRSRLTRHDGPASVRRAYTPAEMRVILARSQAARVDISRHYLFRMGVIAWREAPR